MRRTFTTLAPLIVFAWILCTGLSSTFGQEADVQPAEVLGLDADEAREAALEQLLAQAVQTSEKNMRAKRALVGRVVQLSDQQKRSIEEFDSQRLAVEVKKALESREIPDKGAEKKEKGPNPRALRLRALLPALAQADAVPGFEKLFDEKTLLKEIDKQLDQHIQSVLTADQWAKFQAEQAALLEFHRHSLAQFTLALLRRRIHMSDQQAASILPVLEKNMREDISWVMYIHNANHIPSLPKRALSKLLDHDQHMELKKIPHGNLSNNAMNFAQSIGLEEWNVDNQ